MLPARPPGGSRSRASAEGRARSAGRLGCRTGMGSGFGAARPAPPGRWRPARARRRGGRRASGRPRAGASVRVATDGAGLAAGVRLVGLGTADRRRPASRRPGTTAARRRPVRRTTGRRSASWAMFHTSRYRPPACPGGSGVTGWHAPGLIRPLPRWSSPTVSVQARPRQVASTPARPRPITQHAANSTAEPTIGRLRRSHGPPRARRGRCPHDQPISPIDSPRTTAARPRDSSDHADDRHGPASAQAEPTDERRRQRHRRPG